MKFTKQNKTYTHSVGGYTLIELVVAVGLFAIVAILSVSSFLGVVSSNRKTIAIRTAMDNLNMVIENMARDMKTGSSYHCGSSGAITDKKDCHTGEGYIAFEVQNGDPTSSADQIIYQLGPVGGNCLSSEQICKSTDGGTSFFAVTAPPPELHITGLAFRVYGSESVDTLQPRVVIVIRGYSGADDRSKSEFDVETTVSQRNPDVL